MASTQLLNSNINNQFVAHFQIFTYISALIIDDIYKSRPSKIC